MISNFSTLLDLMQGFHSRQETYVTYLKSKIEVLIDVKDVENKKKRGRKCRKKKQKKNMECESLLPLSHLIFFVL